MGATNLVVESDTSGKGLKRSRSDISFLWEGQRYDLELKTPNTNWRMPGVANLTRPITKNIASIVEDAQKTPAEGGILIVAFVLFPVPRGDILWKDYLTRISKELSLTLTPETHSSQVTLPISKEHFADVVICCFKVEREGSSLIGHATA